MQVDDFDIEMAPAEHMVFFTYADRPGIIGTVGTILGGHGVNIATMDVGRKDEGGEALMCLTVDTPVPPHVLEHIASEIDAQPAARDHAADVAVPARRRTPEPVLHSPHHEAD